MWNLVALAIVALGASIGAWWVWRGAPRDRAAPNPAARRSALVSSLPPATLPAARALTTSKAGAGAGATLGAARVVRRPAAEPHLPTTPMDLAPAADSATGLPAELAAWATVAADSLPPQRLQAVASIFQEVPRPPRLLSRLARLDLTGANGAHELVNLINGEPLIAAKVLAAVNAPAYGLQQPVSAIGQAVTYLGLNCVRSICMQHALQQGFRSDSPQRAERLRRIWQASALAGELALQTSPRVSLPDAGGLACSVLLSFLGELAVAVAVPRKLLGCLPERDHFARTRGEQELIGLGAPEIGRVLMRGWDLPPAVVANVAALDARLLRPISAGRDLGSLRDAWGYLCARLGERLAAGELASLADFDLESDASVELAAMRALHADPRFAALLKQLAAPALLTRIKALLAERRGPRGHAV